MSWSSAVGVATVLQTGRSGICILPAVGVSALGHTQFAVQRVPGEPKLREVNHSLSGAEVTIHLCCPCMPSCHVHSFIHSFISIQP